MNWQIFGLMTYGFGLAMILVVLAFALFSRGQKNLPSADHQNMQKKPDFQQIERLVRLHQDVKDDLAHYGDVLVALRNEQLTTQAHLQRQIDVCLQFIQNEQDKQRINAARQKDLAETDQQSVKQHQTTAERRQASEDHQESADLSESKNTSSVRNHRQKAGLQEDAKEQARKLLSYGMEPDMVSQKTGLSHGEIELISSLLSDDMK